MDKTELRKKMIQIRDSVSVEGKLDYDIAINDTVLSNMGTVHCIGFYASLKHEVDTYVMIQECLISGIRVVLPRIEGFYMHFREINSLQDLKPGTMGILEPHTLCPIVPPEDIDHIYIPMVGFNRERYRLGHGGGFYDRYLVNYPNIKIGLAYHYQEVNASFQQEHDVPCDIIITDKEIITNI